METQASRSISKAAFPSDILRVILALASTCHSQSSECNPLPRTSPSITSVSHNQCRETPDPLLLSYVCSRWRNLILDTPTMWTSIFISSPTEKQLHLLNLWLERGQSCLIDLFFDYSPDLDGGTFKAIVQHLAAHAARLTSFEFISRDQTHARRDMPTRFGEYIQPGSLTTLKALSVFFSTDDRTFLDDFAITFFHPGSNLRICRLTEPQMFSIIPRINRTWSLHLTSLTLFAFGSDLSILPLISNSPSLISLTLGFSICEPDPARSMMVTLPKLQHLILRHVQDCNFVLDWFTLPQLSYLWTVDCFCDGPSVTAIWSGLQAMLERSNCSLKNFSLIHERTNMTNEEYLVEQLSSQKFSTLTNLELWGENMSNVIVEALTTSLGNDENPSSEILPRLESLGLQSCSTDDGKLGLMVLRRFRKVGGTFKQFKLGTNDHGDAHAMDREVFQQLQKEGLIFQWVSELLNI